MVYNRDEIPFFMTVPKLAEVMDINATKAYQLVKVEGFPALRIGKRILIPKEAFLKWLETANGVII